MGKVCVLAGATVGAAAVFSPAAGGVVAAAALAYGAYRLTKAWRALPGKGA